MIWMHPSYHYTDQPSRLTQRHKKFVLGGFIAGVAIIFILVLFWAPWKAEAPAAPQEQAVVENTQPEPEVVEVVEEEPEPEPDFDKTKIAKVVNSWSSKYGQNVSVTIMDKEGAVLASKNPDEVMFAASIYKVYVAYAGYQKIDSGEWKASEKYIGSWSREKCLDEMIRTSNSPCSEKMRDELGRETLTNQLKKYGITNSSLAAVTTTSEDAAKMLVRIYNGTGLSDSSRTKYMASMREQIYRKALPTGFANQTVYDKVGFYETKEYHDTAIVKFKDGRILIVSVLTQNVGTTNIATLGRELAKAAL